MSGTLAQLPSDAPKPGDRKPSAGSTRPSSRLVPAAIAWMLGLALGQLGGSALLWIILALAPTVLLAALLWMRRWRGALGLGLIALVFWGGAWMNLHQRYVPEDWIGRYVGETAQLAVVTGKVEGPAYYSPPRRGAMAQFNAWEPPATQCVLRVSSIRINGRDEPARGSLLLRLQQADDRLQHGAVIAATGWLAQFESAANPGADDLRSRMRRLGLDGRLILENRGNYQLLSPAPAWSWPRMRQRLTDRAADALELGLHHDPARRALLGALLLGRWSADLEELRDSFRRTGLMHLLAISGAHLAILMGLAWLAVRPLVAQPSRAILLVLAILGLYLLALPMQVAIARAGLMAGLLCLGWMMGRRVSSLDMLALAAVILLLINPQDMLSPGFQLSFAVTAGLLLLVRPLEERLLSRRSGASAEGGDSSPPGAVARWLARTLAVAVVGFVISLPLVAHHFQMVSPLALPISLLAGPLVALVIGLGFFKTLAGLVLPSVGMFLAWPLELAADAMILLTQWGARMPGAAVTLDAPPHWAWTLGTLLLGLAWLAGWFAGQRRWLLIGVSAAVLTANLWPWTASGSYDDAPDLEGVIRLRLHTLAVGDGNCHLLRLADARGQNEKTLMFDCGSAGRTDIAVRQIIPALQALGVKRIDLLLLSHVDMDHINGTLDLADALTVRSVAVHPHFLANARREPAGPAAFLLRSLEERNIPVRLLARGWRDTWHETQLEILWPPDTGHPPATGDFPTGSVSAGDSEDDSQESATTATDPSSFGQPSADPPADTHPGPPNLHLPRSNDQSLVLSIRHAGRRILLNGDIAQQAASLLLAQGTDLKADLADLPHHGAFVRASPSWLRAVQPRWVIQSNSLQRMQKDRWESTLSAEGVQRWSTAAWGMLSVHINDRGELAIRGYRSQPVTINPPLDE